jgi:glycosyltransferase involved in cell wall biosynthesis
MRIVQVIALYPPEFRGGATLVCERLAAELAARGHTLLVFSGRSTPDEVLGAVRREPIDGIDTWRVNVGGAFQPWSRENYDNPIAESSFLRLLATARPDVVHAHSLQGLGVGIIRAAAGAGIPVVLSMHDWWWLCPCIFRLTSELGTCPPIVRPERCSGRTAYPFAERRRILQAALQRTARIVTPSAYLRDSLIANGLPPEGFVVQENGVPGPGAAREVAPDGAGPLRVAYIGGAGNREKGLTVLLDAARLLPRDGFTLDCHAVAEGEAKPWSSELGGSLRCHPPFAPERLDEVLTGADVLVVPSLMRESYSLVVREALLRCVPVVTSDCGGPEEVVREGANGLIVPTGDAPALACALARLIDDRELVRRLAAGPKPSVPSMAQHGLAAESLYRSVLHQAEVREAPSPVPAAATRSALPAPPLEGRRVLFLTGIDGAPLRYRVWHLVEQLAACGVESRVLYHSDIATRTAVAEADCVVLFRAPYSVSVAAVVAEARRRRIPVVFSIDDLAFRGDRGADAPALGLADRSIVAGYQQSVREYERSCKAADFFLGNTEALVAAAAEIGMPAFLHRNGLGNPILALSEAARAARRGAAAQAGTARPDVVRLGYFSGTDTHDGDLALLAEPLARVLRRFPQTTLCLVGPLRLPPALAALDGQIERRSFVPWSELPALLAETDVNLAPLTLPSAFNHAKSEVKYLEAAAAGVPTLASPSPAFRHAASGGGVLLADCAESWEGELGRLIADPGLRAGLGRAARRDVYRRYCPLVQRHALEAILREIVTRGPREGGKALSPIAMEAGGGSLVALEPESCVYDACQLEAESGGPLGPQQEVEQSFVCRRDGVWRVDVRVGTYARRNQHEVLFTVLDDRGSMRGRRSVSAAFLVDRSWVAIDLAAPIRDSAGRCLTIRAEAPEAREGNEVLLWHAPSDAGNLTIGGRAVPGRSLAFRSFAESVV